MGRRSKRTPRCERCRMPSAHCLCSRLPRLALTTRVVLVMHFREAEKASATGPMALAALDNSELHLHGALARRLDLSHLNSRDGDILVLFPGDGAVPLQEIVSRPTERPSTLVVPDGNWQQARRMTKRLFGLQRQIRVTLPAGPPTEWGVRRETREGGLATFEAIARALGILESDEVQAQLETYFRLMVRTTFALKGCPQRAPMRHLAGDSEL